LNGMVRANVQLLKTDKELIAFFKEVTGHGYAHPWLGSPVNLVFPAIPLLVLLRAMDDSARIFKDEGDVYDWLLYDVMQPPTTAGEGRFDV